MVESSSPSLDPMDVAGEKILQLGNNCINGIDGHLALLKSASLLALVGAQEKQLLDGGPSETASHEKRCLGCSLRIRVTITIETGKPPKTDRVEVTT